MGKNDARIDSYIGRAAGFARPILKHLRGTVHAACPEVVETIKWGMPFFTHQGNLCHMAAFKHHCAFGFWKGSLIFGRTEREGMGHLGKITCLADLPKAKILAGYLKRAVALNEAGVKVPAQTRTKLRKALKVPEYFAAALQSNPKARKTFENFSFNHKREYVDWVAEAKREETRKRRLETTLKWLAAGKSRNWNWE